MSILTREEEREPCRERGERKRRESEGVHGWRGERATEMGIAFVPLPSLTLATHPVASRERHLRGCRWHDSQAVRGGEARGNQTHGAVGWSWTGEM